MPAWEAQYEVGGASVSLEAALFDLRADALAEAAESGLERALAATEAEAREEAVALREEQQLAEAAGDAVVSLLLGLVREDEERDYLLLERITATLRDERERTHSSAALHCGPLSSGCSGPSLAQLAGRLADAEDTRAQQLRAIALQQRTLERGLPRLLLEMMAADREKHARILRFVQGRLQTRGESSATPA